MSIPGWETQIAAARLEFLINCGFRQSQTTQFVVLINTGSVNCDSYHSFVVAKIYTHKHSSLIACALWRQRDDILPCSVRGRFSLFRVFQRNICFVHNSYDFVFSDTIYRIHIDFEIVIEVKRYDIVFAWSLSPTLACVRNTVRFS